LSKKFAKLAALLAVFALAGVAWAAGNTQTWKAAGDRQESNWATAANWSGSGVPGDGDIAKFSNGNTTVFVSNDTTPSNTVVSSIDVSANQAIILTVGTNTAFFQISGDLVLTEGASLTFNPTTGTNSHVQLSKDIGLNGNGTMPRIITGTGATVTFNTSVDIGGVDGAAVGSRQLIQKQGPGTLVFNGPANHILSGAGISVDEGVLQIGAKANLLVDGLKGITLSADARTRSVKFVIGGALSKDLSLYVGNGAVIDTGTDNVNFGAGVVKAPGTTNTPSITKQGTGTWTLAANTWTGVPLNLAEGKVVTKASPEAASSIVSIDISDGATLSVAKSAQVGYLTGKGAVEIDRDQTLTVNGESKFEGSISGKGALTINTLKTVELDSANTYTGDTTVESGILKLSKALAPASKITLDDGTSLDVAFSLGNEIAFGSDSSIIVADGETAELTGKVRYSDGTWNKFGEGTLTLGETIDARRGGDSAVKVVEGTLSVKSGSAFDEIAVQVAGGATFEAVAGLTYEDVDVEFGDGAIFKSELSAARVGTPVATFRKVATNDQQLILSLSLGDGLVKDAVYKIFSAEELGLDVEKLTVQNEAGIDITDSFEKIESQNGSVITFSLKLLSDVDTITLGDLSKTTADPGTLYSGTIGLSKAAGTLDPVTTTLDWLEVKLSTDKTALEVSGDVPAAFTSGTFTVTVRTAAAAGVLPGSATKTYTLTSSAPAPTVVDAADVLAPKDGALFSQEPARAVVGQPVKVTFTIGLDKYPGGVTNVQLLFNPTLTGVTLDSSAAPEYSFTIPAYATGQAWGFTFDYAGKSYKVNPTLSIAAETPIGALKVALTAEGGNGTITLKYGVYNDGVALPAGYLDKQKVSVSYIRGTETPVVVNLPDTSGAKLDEHVIAGVPAGTYSVTATSGTVNSSSVSVTVTSGGSGGGGCDAGFAGLALLLAAPLFMRKKSK
jgi:Synergist-CTERM protein sorting domain-containing protein